MDRRGFLRRGVVVGMAGALIGASVGKTQEAEASGGGIDGVPMACQTAAMDPLPELPARREVPVTMTWGTTAMMLPDYVWDPGKPITVDAERNVALNVEVNGRRYVLYGSTPYDQEV